MAAAAAGAGGGMGPSEPSEATAFGRSMAGRAVGVANAMVQLDRSQTHLVAPSEYDTVVQDTVRAWRGVCQQAEDLAAVAAVICAELATQTVKVDDIASNMTTAEVKTVGGGGEVVEADMSKASSWSWKSGATGAIIGGTVGIIGGPLGVGIGATAGTAVGSFLGSIPKIFVKNDVRNSQATLATLSSSSNHSVLPAAATDDESGTGLLLTEDTRFEERARLQADAAMAAACKRNRGRNTYELLADVPTENPAEDEGVREMKVRCLIAVIRAMEATAKASELLESDREALTRIRHSDETIGAAQSIAAHHVSGMENGWWGAFLRTLMPTSGRPSLLARASSLFASNGDGRDSLEAPTVSEKEEIVAQIQRMICELKQGQGAMGAELKAQVAELERLNDSVDLRQARMDSLNRRVDNL
mmetsp:Transcript_3196/g.7777  ORF Transcript_3196/g.7777 Transcript_3196/m.7777 type:complete len:417 (-) Transcript_3196:144-1394(-)